MCCNEESQIRIKSEQGEYQVSFFSGQEVLPWSSIDKLKPIFVCDAEAYTHHKDGLLKELDGRDVIFFKASEASKEYLSLADLFEAVLSRECNTDTTIVGIGGGSLQDAVTFVSSLTHRGINWVFIPTTLLAQADSCIGGKSAINFGGLKNMLGNFWPPKQVLVHSGFLSTLSNSELRSGFGEIIKVHAIKGPECFSQLVNTAKNFETWSTGLITLVESSLRLKKEIIETDEYDRGIRRLLNYGHTFGHAIESASNFKIPHGIAVTIGMDLANFVAQEIGVSNEHNYCRMHLFLSANYGSDYRGMIDASVFEKSLLSDKKHRAGRFLFILPDLEGNIRLAECSDASNILRISMKYLRQQDFLL